MPDVDDDDDDDDDESWEALGLKVVAPVVSAIAAAVLALVVGVAAWLTKKWVDLSGGVVARRE